MTVATGACDGWGQPGGRRVPRLRGRRRHGRPLPVVRQRSSSPWSRRRAAAGSASPGSRASRCRGPRVSGSEPLSFLPRSGEAAAGVPRQPLREPDRDMTARSRTSRPHSHRAAGSAAGCWRRSTAAASGAPAVNVVTIISSNESANASRPPATSAVRIWEGDVAERLPAVGAEVGAGLLERRPRAAQPGDHVVVDDDDAEGRVADHDRVSSRADVRACEVS